MPPSLGALGMASIRLTESNLKLVNGTLNILLIFMMNEIECFIISIYFFPWYCFTVMKANAGFYKIKTILFFGICIPHFWFLLLVISNGKTINYFDLNPSMDISKWHYLRLKVTMLSLNYIFCLFVFLSHTWNCSGIISSSVLRNYSLYQGTI